MGKLLDNLNKQLNSEYKKEAEDCLLIYNTIKEATGHVWQDDWNTLTKRWSIGIFPNSIRFYKPSELGKIFLNGIITNQ